MYTNPPLLLFGLTRAVLLLFCCLIIIQLLQQQEVLVVDSFVLPPVSSSNLEVTQTARRTIKSSFILMDTSQSQSRPQSQPQPQSLTQSLTQSITTTHESTMMKFGRFTIPSHHIFYTSTSSFAFVNLRPILPGHVLVSPKRVVPRLRDLDSQEYTDLWLAVREVQNMLEQHYTPTKDDDKDQVLSFNVAVQDGLGAGQSVPHVHVHLLPRLAGDFERNDDVYDELEQWAPRSDMPKEKLALEVPDDGDRKDRTTEQMGEEAATYRSYFLNKI